MIDDNRFKILLDDLNDVSKQNNFNKNFVELLLIIKNISTEIFINNLQELMKLYDTHYDNFKILISQLDHTKFIEFLHFFLKNANVHQHAFVNHLLDIIENIYQNMTEPQKDNVRKIINNYLITKLHIFSLNNADLFNETMDSLFIIFGPAEFKVIINSIEDTFLRELIIKHIKDHGVRESLEQLETSIMDNPSSLNSAKGIQDKKMESSPRRFLIKYTFRQ